MATTKSRKKANVASAQITQDSTTSTATKQSKKASTKTTKKAAKKTTKKTAKKSTRKTANNTSKGAEHKAANAAASAMKDIIARARDHFRKAPQEHVFYVMDGRSIQDLRELAESLEDMAEHVFAHHVNDERHDFANWVHEVLQERALAEQLREAQKHPDAHQRVIYRHIVRRAW